MCYKQVKKELQVWQRLQKLLSDDDQVER